MGDPRHTVLRWLVAYNARDVAGALALAHPEIVIRPMRWVPAREYYLSDRALLEDLGLLPEAASDH